MGLLDKVKNLFTEEVDIEETEEIRQPKQKKKKTKEREEPIQKEVIKVEIPSPKETRSKSNSNMYEDDDLFEESREPEYKPEPPKEEYKFPFFDDDDFDTIEVKREEKPQKKEIKPDIYNPPKEEKKVFKPSPIISPVFGFMDKDFSKEEIINKKKSYSAKKATVDEIRDKAFGTLESDIESTLFGTGRVLFDENDKELEDIPEEKSLDEKEEYDSNVISEKPRHEDLGDEEDLTDLLEAEMAKPESKKTKDKKPRKISDKELFNLIDSMYEGEKK